MYICISWEINRDLPLSQVQNWMRKGARGPFLRAFYVVEHRNNSNLCISLNVTNVIFARIYLCIYIYIFVIYLICICFL